MADLLGVETGWVWLRDPASDRFYSAAVQNLPPYLQEPVRMTGKSCWCLELFQSGQLTARNIDVVECSRLAPAVKSPQAAETQGLRCHASVPLYAGDRPLGVMNLAMRGLAAADASGAGPADDDRDQVGVAIERARLGEQSIQHARADERARIARDVHDTLAQSFTAVALQIETALSRLEPADAGAPSLRRALDVARQGVDEARRSISALRASPLEDRPLGEALGVLARAVHRRHRRAGPRRDRRRRRAARRSRVRAVQDRQRSADQRPQARGAREASLRLDVVGSRLRLSVSDAGHGFGLRGARGRGFGLQGIADRARLAGGRADGTERTRPGHERDRDGPGRSRRAQRSAASEAAERGSAPRSRK